MPLGTSAGRTTSKTRSASKTQAKQQDAIKLLMADHDEVEALFKQFQKLKNDGAQKADIVEQICKALTVHAEIEEEIFYPAAREALAEKDDDLLDEAEVEHASIKSLVEQLQDADPSDEMYDAKVKARVKGRAKVTAIADPLVVRNLQATPAPVSRVLLFAA